MLEIRLYGRGGQGIVTAAELLVNAVLREGKWGQSTPYFGAERRGAAVSATVRVADTPIRVHGQSSNPDAVAVFEHNLMETVDVTSGLKKGGLLIINSPHPPELAGDFRVVSVDATQIALDRGLVVSGFPFVNASMVGAVVKATQVCSLESALQATAETWKGELGQRNCGALRRAYETTLLEGVKVA
ncbi:MAG TPA: 2-oxoacid:acceptor oxidoreductase family protein [Conexivisphaerales archaeon]|nr:2-oxoacid:acceptor oxidoreductase family protein [Conexivisphaerales archaeon]